MAYLRIWLHCVWGTKKRFPYFNSSNLVEVCHHIKENAFNKGIHIDFINGHQEHLHCILSLNPEQTISKTIQLLKGESSFWINQNKITSPPFEWADEYFAVSISNSQIDKVREYIKNQEKHHQIKTWNQEYEEFISKYGFTKREEG